VLHYCRVSEVLRHTAAVDFDHRFFMSVTPVQMSFTQSTLKRLSAPVIMIIAAVYFLIDAVFVWLLRPVTRWIAGLPVMTAIARAMQSLGPYPTLLLFAIPVILLEPVKPVGLFLIATHHAASGITVIVIGEVLKIGILERLFAMSKDKLLTIPLFARGYWLVVNLLDYLRSFEAWQLVVRQIGRVKEFWQRIAPARRHHRSGH
jgi:hypothetical protein